ncbi:HEAT repeat domain-containing protein [Amnibacterium soli]|uniref:HEAT repeat domain-containing protein n=1 Tax=Amnibacterium soli TaxID=1282736 RepID=A0ABP8YZY6_9MICO
MSADELALRLRSADGSARLRAALDAGTRRDPASVEVLVERCGVEPDFFVRDMLTWALTRLPADLTVPRLVEELASPFPQARSQALHTLSKVGDPRARPALTPALLHDEEDGVARAAWRAAVVLTPVAERTALAEDLATELGRRNRECWRTLSEVLVAVGEPARTVLDRVADQGTYSERAHAAATLLLLDGLARDFRSAVEEAQRLALEADPERG